MKSGKRVYYYYAYHKDGRRSTAKSTGQTTKATARAYCRQLEKEEMLIPQESKAQMVFKIYFENWWVWGPDPERPTICPYLTRRYLRNNKPSYAHSYTTLNKYKKHILSFFAEMMVADISCEDIERWLDGLALKGLCGKTQIALMSILRTMLKEAKRKKDIPTNPMVEVIPPRKNKPKKRGILTVEETKMLFDMERIDEVWRGDFQAMGAFLLARDTAMRPGEVRAIQMKHINFHKNGECTVDILQAVDHRSHLFKETKTGAVLEDVPVRPDTAGILRRICQMFDDSEDLLFSKDGQEHVSENYLKRRLYRAFQAIGITEELRKERNLTQYSFRYLAITRLRQQGVNDMAVRSLARHKTPIMTDGYTVFGDEESINPIRDIYRREKKASGGF